MRPCESTTWNDSAVSVRRVSLRGSGTVLPVRGMAAAGERQSGPGPVVDSSGRIGRTGLSKPGCASTGAYPPLRGRSSAVAGKILESRSSGTGDGRSRASDRGPFDCKFGAGSGPRSGGITAGGPASIGLTFDFSGNGDEPPGLAGSVTSPSISGMRIRALGARVMTRPTSERSPSLARAVRVYDVPGFKLFSKKEPSGSVSTPTGSPLAPSVS